MVHFQGTVPQIPDRPAKDPQVESQKLDYAIRAAARELERLTEALGPAGDSTDVAGIFAAHQMLLEDPSLRQRAGEEIVTGRRAAAAAWKAVIDELVAEHQSLEDPYQRARAADVTVFLRARAR